MNIRVKPIETKRLMLRQITMEDSVKMYNNWAKDYNVAKYLSWGPHHSIDDTQKIISKWIKDYEKKQFYLWIIIEKSTMEPIGTVGVVHQNKKIYAEVGYCLGRNWWGLGFATEAVKQVIWYLFEEASFQRVIAICNKENIASQKVLEKCGLRINMDLTNRLKNSYYYCMDDQQVR